jgi:hypothetical protein
VRRESRLLDRLAWLRNLDQTCGSVRSSLPTPALTVMAEWEAVGTTYPDPLGPEHTARCLLSCQHQGGRGARLGGRTNRCEPAINLVKVEQAKGADKPGPKGTQSAASLHIGGTRTRRLPGKSWGLTHRVTPAEHGKPVPLPHARQANRKGGRWGCGQEISEKANAGL